MDTFEEVESKIIEINKRRSNARNMNNKPTLEEVLENINPRNKTNENKHMKVIVLLHPTHHPKDVSRKILQMTFNKTCKENFKDILNVDQCIIACHNPDNVRRLMTSSSLK